jgi:4-amino-4-deoxy-L-arabinose transferase-like glycosyltransferase
MIRPMGRTVADTAVAAALGAVVLTGAALRLHQLGSESLWLDEAFSLTIANSTPAYIVETTSEDVHPPLYYFLLYGWVHLLGGTPWVARLFSVAASVGLLGLVFVFGTRLADSRTGVVAAGLLAISPFQIEYAQEARMYALLALASTAATYCLWRLMEDLAAFDGPASPMRSRTIGWTAGYAVLASMLPYLHVHGWFTLAAHACVLIVYVARRGRSADRLLLLWTVALLVVAAAFLIWLPTFYLQVRQVQAGFWIPPPEVDGLLAALRQYSGSATLLWILGGLALLGTWSARAREGQPVAPAVLLLPWFLVPVLLPYALSFAGESIFLPKYTIAASIPFSLLAAIGASRASRWWQIAAAAIAIAAVCSLSMGELRKYYPSVRKDQWREMVAAVEARARPGDVLVFHPYFTQIPYNVYGARTDLVAAPFPKHASQLTTTTLPYVFDQLRGDRQRVWLILMSFDARKPLLLSALQSRFRSVERIKTFHIDAYLCEYPVGPAVRAHEEGAPAPWKDAGLRQP